MIVAIRNQSKVIVDIHKNFLFVVVYPRVSLHPGPHHAIDGGSYTLPSCHVTVTLALGESHQVHFPSEG